MISAHREGCSEWFRAIAKSFHEKGQDMNAYLASLVSRNETEAKVSDLLAEVHAAKARKAAEKAAKVEEAKASREPATKAGKEFLISAKNAEMSKLSTGDFLAQFAAMKASEKAAKAASRPLTADIVAEVSSRKAVETSAKSAKSVKSVEKTAIKAEPRHDAASFLTAIKFAGNRILRNANGVFYLAIQDRRDIRDDGIVAMRNYLGYDNARDFGGQLMASEIHAKRVLAGKYLSEDPTVPYLRNRQVSGDSVVFGVPVSGARLGGNLQARESLQAEILSELEQKAAHSEGQKLALIQAQAEFETARLESIRADFYENCPTNK